MAKQYRCNTCGKTGTMKYILDTTEGFHCNHGGEKLLYLEPYTEPNVPIKEINEALGEGGEIIKEGEGV